MRLIKTIIFIVVVLLQGISSVKAYQLSGRITLDGTTSYENIIVRAVNNENPTFYYSAITTTSGFFNIDVPEGIYRVYATKVGFHKKILSNRLTVQKAEELGQNNLTAEKYRILTPPIKGKLSSDSVYYLLQSTELTWADQLIIETGAKIKLADNVGINIYGSLLVKGSNDLVQITSIEEESNINNWEYIHFYNYVAIGVYFSNVDFSFGKNISWENYVPLISQCSFRWIQSMHINGEGERMQFNHSTFDYCGSINLSTTNSGNIEIAHNKFTNSTNNTFNFSTESTTNINANTFFNCGEVMVVNNSNLKNYFFTNNLIKKCYKGISYSGNGMHVYNNTFTENTFGIYGAGELYAANNIFMDIEIAPLGLFVDILATKANYHIEYNLFWNNATDIVYYVNSNEEKLSIATGTKVNRNNIPCDNNFNIKADPLFIDSTLLRTQSISPLIDAGMDVTQWLKTDVENNLRKRDGNNSGTSHCDIGPYEFELASAPKTYTFKGTVYRGDSTYHNAKVVLFQVNSKNIKAIRGTFSNTNGEYLFSDLLPDKYFAYAIPNPLTEDSYAPSYFFQKHLWVDAYPIELIGNVLNADIQLKPYVLLDTGINIVSGYIDLSASNRNHDAIFSQEWFAGFGTGSGLNNVSVFLEKDGKLVQWCLTKNNGYYQFNHVPNGEYRLIIEYAGYTKHSIIKVPAEQKSSTIASGKEVVESKTFPNPTTGFLTISANTTSATGECLLYTSTGKMVMHLLLANSNQIDVSSLPSGYYFGKLITDQSIFQFRFLKK